MPSTSNDFFVLVWTLNCNWTYIAKEFLLKDCQEQCFLQIVIGRLSEAEFPQNFCWKIVGSSVSFKFLLEDCGEQCFLPIFIGRLSGAVFPSNFYWKIVGSSVSFEFVLEDCQEQIFLWIFVCENSVRCKTRLVFRKTEETVSYLLTLKKFRMQSKFRDEANVVSWKQRIYIFWERTASPPPLS